jgi:hypothetical protein
MARGSERCKARSHWVPKKGAAAISNGPVLVRRGARVLAYAASGGSKRRESTIKAGRIMGSAVAPDRRGDQASRAPSRQDGGARGARTPRWAARATAWASPDARHPKKFGGGRLPPR